MANRLQMAKVNTIQTLHARGWSGRRIARELGIDRKTVQRHIHRATSDDSNAATPAMAPPGSQVTLACETVAFETVLSAERPSSPGSPGRAGAESSGDTQAVLSASQCEPYREAIERKVAQGLSAKRIHQDLMMGVEGAPSYYSVRRFVCCLTGGEALPFRRMECEPGVECQVDFGKGAPVVQIHNDRCTRKRSHVLRVVLSHSRKGYSESVYRQTTEGFIRCIEDAFWHFGGVPQTLVLDNLRAAVTKADWFDPEINPKVQSFCKHYGIAALPTKPYTPRHKGKVERGIDYVQNNALKGHTFDSLEAQNRHLLHWETSVADTRIHGTTRKQVGKVFEEVERPTLQPLPATRFPFFHEAQRSVHRDGHVEVDKSYYSVGPEYLGRRLWVRWDSRLVRIFNGRMEQIALHTKQEPGKFSTHDSHISSRKINGVERGAARLLDKARMIGPQAGNWSESMLQVRGIGGVRVLLGLVNLSNRHSFAEIDQACAIAVSHGAYRLRSIRSLIKRTAGKQNTFQFIDEHPIIRSLDDYGQFVKTAIAKEHWT